MARSGLCVPASIAPRVAVLGLQYAVAFRAERGSQEAPDLGLVLDDQDGGAQLGHAVSCGTGGAASRGSVNRNAVPPSGRRSAQMRPPCSVTMARQMARPRPAPPMAPSLFPRWNLREHLLRIAGGQARPGILDRDEQSAITPCCTELDGGAWRRVLGGILEQIGEYLLNQCCVHAHQGQIGRQFDPDWVGSQLLAKAVQNRPGDLAECVPVAIERNGAGFEPGHLEHVGHEFAHLS